MRDVFLFAGQSNASGYSPTIALNLSGQRYPTYGSGSAPYYVPGYAQTDINEWTGAPPASVDTGTMFAHPDAANAPCLYNQAVNNPDQHDSWGSYVLGTPNPSTGVVAPSGTYGLEVSFLLRHLTVYPTATIGAVKVTLGGSGLASDWLPADTGSNNTGTDRGQWTVLEEMVGEAAARLDDSEPGAWRWAGFVWMQGESGAHTWGTTPELGDDSTYLADARLFFAAVRTLCGRSNLPVVVGVIADSWGWESAPNPYLVTYDGNGYTAIDYSITSSGQSVTAQKRINALAGAVRRRATQRTLGADQHCCYFENDNYPHRPPVSLTAASNDTTAYHWGGPGNLAAGERAFVAYDRLIRRRTRVKFSGRRLLLRGAV